jgi:hypothetical protein
MGRTVAEHVELVRRRVLATARGVYNFLTVPLTATGTTVTLDDDILNITRGNLLGIGDELVYVRRTDPGTRAVTVARGWQGTTAVVHNPGDPVEMSPRFPVADIVDTMAEEIGSWAPDLFRVATVTIPMAWGTYAYDIPTDDVVLFGLALDFEPDRPGLPHLTGSTRHPRYKFLRNRDPVQYPHGTAIELEQDPGAVTATFTYATDYTVNLATFGLATDLAVDVGVGDDQLPVLTYGTMWRLMSSREIGRADMHGYGESRKSEDVPAGLQMNITKLLEDTRRKTMADASLSLRSLYPYRNG